MKTNRIIRNHRKLMKIIQIDQDPLITTVKKNKKKPIRTKDHHTDNDHTGNQYDY